MTTLPEGYELTLAQEESLRTFPVTARIQKLQTEIIPDAKKAIATAAEKITSAADRTARTLAQLGHAAAERSLAIAQAELANLTSSKAVYEVLGYLWTVQRLILRGIGRTVRCPALA